jgi:hypothetical protein
MTVPYPGAEVMAERDIVERLRAVADDGVHKIERHLCCHEAAAEITRLRAALLAADEELRWRPIDE